MATTTKVSYTGVMSTHPAYDEMVDKWESVRLVMRSDCKSLLRDISVNEPDSDYGKARQDEYENGAILYNFSRRTRDGMVGGVFHKPPNIELPDGLQYLMEDADGNSVGLIQQSKDSVQQNIEVSRLGLLVDMPDSKGKTRKDQNSGLINPKILPYTAESIINWRVKRIGAVNKLVMIVLHEKFEYLDNSNEFNVLYGDQYRVLDLLDGVYRQRVWKYDPYGSDEDYLETNGEPIEIRANGKLMDYIPFFFIGGQNNDYTIDDPIMGPITELNIGHYRNSADNEESSFIVGQPTLFISPGADLSVEDFKKANPSGIKFGSRMGHNIGSGGSAMLIQADPNNLAKENMLDKETQALKIGAQLISPTQNVTAESARIQRTADNSVLSIAAQNVSSAYEMALKSCADFLGLSESEIKFNLSTEFFDEIMTAQERAQWLSEINMGVIPMTEYWEAMRRSGLTKKTNEELESELMNQPMQGMIEDDQRNADTP